ncbi:hypothetical protein PC116_g33822, partial [Phytophthora cactorum]
MIEDSDDDQPLTAKLASKRKAIEKNAEKEAKAINASEAKSKKSTPKKAVKDESDDDVPLAGAKGKKRPSNGINGKTKTNGVKKEESDSDAPIRKKAKTAPSKANVKTEKATPAKKAPAKKAKKEVSEEPAEGEDEEEEYRWWDAPKKEDDSIKWTTLEHNGVLFPPP